MNLLRRGEGTKMLIGYEKLLRFVTLVYVKKVFWCNIVMALPQFTSTH